MKLISRFKPGNSREIGQFVVKFFSGRQQLSEGTIDRGGCPLALELPDHATELLDLANNGLRLDRIGGGGRLLVHGTDQFTMLVHPICCAIAFMPKGGNHAHKCETGKESIQGAKFVTKLSPRFPIIKAYFCPSKTAARTRAISPEIINQK